MGLPNIDPHPQKRAPFCRKKGKRDSEGYVDAMWGWIRIYRTQDLGSHSTKQDCVLFVACCDPKEIILGLEYRDSKYYSNDTKN